MRVVISSAPNHGVYQSLEPKPQILWLFIDTAIGNTGFKTIYFIIDGKNSNSYPLKIMSSETKSRCELVAFIQVFPIFRKGTDTKLVSCRACCC